MSRKIIQNALINSGATAFYIIGVVSLIYYVPKMLGLDKVPDNFLMPVVMLLLFVISAAITGSLVFGRPILWYLDGKKREAVMLLCWTLVFLIITTVFLVPVIYLAS